MAGSFAAGAAVGGIAVAATQPRPLTHAPRSLSPSAYERKDATETTKAANKKLLESLSLADKQDFEDAKRGFIAWFQLGTMIWATKSPDRHSIAPKVWVGDTTARRLVT